MSNSIAVPSEAAALQFDRAVNADGTEAGHSPTGVTCSQCQRPIMQSYFTMSETPFCGRCKLAVERSVAATRTPGAFLKALAYGTGAAIAGAAIYYAVIALLDLEIGIVSILIGYMVGYAIRHAARGGGGRRYQVLGAALTYFAVGLAYMPVAIKSAQEGEKALNAAVANASRAADSLRAADSSRAPRAADTVSAVVSSDPVHSGPRRRKSFWAATAILIFFAFALPVIAIVGSMPSGLISLLIMALGMRQAWRMTAATDLAFVGPLKVAPPANLTIDDAPAATSA